VLPIRNANDVLAAFEAVSEALRVGQRIYRAVVPLDNVMILVAVLRVIDSVLEFLEALRRIEIGKDLRLIFEDPRDPIKCRKK